MSKDAAKAHLEKTANEAQLWWVRTMQRAVEGHGGSTASKVQLELKESLKREDELKVSLEEKELQLKQLQNSNRAQINQLHKALVTAKQENEALQSSVKAVDAGSASPKPQTASARSISGASVGGDESCLGGLLAMLQRKTTDKAVLDAVPAVDIKELQKALSEAKADASKLHDALQKAKELHMATCKSLEAKVASLENEREQLMLQLHEEGEKSEKRAEAFKRLQLQTSTERSRDAEMLDEHKAHIKQLTADIASVRADLDYKCDEVKRIEELHQAALREILEKPVVAEELDDLAEELHQEREQVASLASQAEAQLAKNRSLEAANALFEVMDDNHDGRISRTEFEAHRAEYERVVAENDRLEQEAAALAAVQEHIAKLEEECSRMQAEEKQLRAENAHLNFIKEDKARLEQEVHALTTGMEESIALNERLQKELEARAVPADGRQAELLRELEARDQDIKVLQQELAATLEDQSRMPPALGDEEGIQPDVAVLHQELHMARSAIAERNVEIERYQAENERLEREIAVIAAQLDDSEAMNDKLQQALQTSRLSGEEDPASDSMQETFMLRAENNRLEKELQVMTVTSEDHQAETDRMRRDARQAELTQALQESGEQLDQLMVRINEQQEELKGLREEKLVLEQVRDQASVLVAEFDAQQAEAEKTRIENSALAEDNRNLRLTLQDAQNECAVAAEANGRLSLVTPWFNRAGASYMNRVEVDFNSFESLASAAKEANASFASHMASKIESGDTVKIAMQRYRLLDSERVTTESGELEWNNNALCDFVQAVFLQLGLVPPDEPLIFELYRLFDPDPCKGYLVMEESVCLADAALRATFATAAVESNAVEASILAEQLDGSQQQVEGLRSQLLELESKLRRTEARATLAEKERDAIEKALAASQDALTASQGSRVSVTTSHGMVGHSGRWQGSSGVDPRDVAMHHSAPCVPSPGAPARPIGRPMAKPLVAVERVRGSGTSRRV